MTADRINALEEALRLVRPIVEGDLAQAKDMNDADWIGMSQNALDAIDKALATPSEPQARGGEELERWGLRWKGHDNAVVEPMADGYWTPWHIAQEILAALRQSPAASENHSSHVRNMVDPAASEVG